MACSPDENEKIFPYLRWAAALKDWPGPQQGERPTGYVIILGDTDVYPTFSVDPGIVAQSMLLAAVEQGLGGCMIGSIDRKGLRRAMDIPESLEIVLVVALGAPKETVVLEEAERDGSTDYWRDADDVHHVPKRSLQEIIVASHAS